MSNSEKQHNLRVAFVVFVVSLVTISFVNAKSKISAQSPMERVLDNRVPSHLPIKVRLRKEKEKAVKDAGNETWLRDFDLEVTNTGDRPIYFLHFALSTDVRASDGRKIGFTLDFGRGEFMDLETKATAADVPLKPGETIILNPAGVLTMEGWAEFRKQEKKPDAMKLILRFQILSFGDGTGFAGTTGIHMPSVTPTI